MIYMDNAATSYPKPPCVSSAVVEAIQNAGNPGRGIHKLAAWSSLCIAQARIEIAELFNISDPIRVAFTMNATHSLNIAVNLCRGRIVTTSMEHNSVLRTIHRRGKYTIVKADADGHISPDKVIEAACNKNVGAVVMTHASNVTGEIYDIGKIGEFCNKNGILFIVDAAQSGGCVPIDVEKMHIDCLCFTGHKSLFGQQGTGGIYLNDNIKIKPLLVGGTGSMSHMLTMPQMMPDCFEAGTMNTHGICTLSAGIKYVKSIGIEQIHLQEKKLRDFFVKKLKEIRKITVYGRENVDYTGVISVSVEGKDPTEVGEFLAEHGICCRVGFHCAPLAHRTLGTQNEGTVRFSINHMNTEEEIDYVIEMLNKI